MLLRLGLKIIWQVHSLFLCGSVFVNGVGFEGCVGGLWCWWVCRNIDQLFIRSSMRLKITYFERTNNLENQIILNNRDFIMWNKNLKSHPVITQWISDTDQDSRIILNLKHRKFADILQYYPHRTSCILIPFLWSKTRQKSSLPLVKVKIFQIHNIGQTKVLQEKQHICCLF